MESENKSSIDRTVDVTHANQPRPARVVSVDTLRGLVILLMVFVNDLGPAAPSWMHHIQPPDADGMTLADIVFPAFLFIVGVSIPLAIERSLKRGETRWRIMGHVLVRTLGLLLMGLIGVNSSADTTLGTPLWGTLAYTAIVFAWCVVPRPAQAVNSSVVAEASSERRRRVMIGLKSIGVIGVVLLLAVFRRTPEPTEVMFFGTFEEWRWLKTQWWGILGLIGWAYLTASLVYLLLRKQREWLMGAMAMLLVFYVSASGDGLFARADDKVWLQPLLPMLNGFQSLLQFCGQYVDLRSATGSLAAISVAGSLLGTTLAGPQQFEDHNSRLSWAATFALGLFIGGLLFDSFGGINKIAATPTWCLWCASIACVAWAVVYYLMDVKGIERWSVIARPAGANPLIAYLLHPVLLGCISLAGLSPSLLSYKNSSSSMVVIAGSIGMALFVCFLTGLIARAGLRVRI